MSTFTVAFRGRDMRLQLAEHSTTCNEVAEYLQQQLQQPLALNTLRLLVPKHGAVQLLQEPSRLLSDTGIRAGSRCILLGSFQAELQALEASKQAEASLRLPGFEYEAQRAAARSIGLPTAGPGKHYFGSFKVLPPNPFAPPGAPPPSAALSLLHKLASDPAIAAVMEHHGWTVPLLSEMPPEGKVGVSAVCVLGYNVNNGQEISLRLRTDDYAGFRKYLAIRRTLVHELTHNVWSDHDINFKMLNSQLLKEVEQYEAAHGAGQTLTGIQAAYTPAASVEQHQPARGRTLAAAAAAEGQQLLNHRVLAAPEVARAAAMARAQQQQQQQQQQQGLSAEDWRAALNRGQAISAAAMDSAGAGVASAGPGSSGASASSVAAASASAAAADLQQYEHDDPVTAAAEAAAERLGSVQPGDEDMLPPGKHVQQPKAGTLSVGPPLQQQQQQQQLHGLGSHMLADQQAAAVCTLVDAFGSQGLATEVLQQQEKQHYLNEQGCGCCQQQDALPAPAGSGAGAAAGSGAGHPMQCDAAGNSVVQDHTAPAAAAPEAGQHANSIESWSAEDAAAFEGLDFVLVRKMQQAGQLIQQLVQQSSSSGLHQQRVALETLAGVLVNLAEGPKEPRYRRLRYSNAAFQRKLGRFSAARQLLLLAGFAELQQQQQTGGVSEAVLVYVRDDPGLVWLVLSVVREALQKLPAAFSQIEMQQVNINQVSDFR